MKILGFILIAGLATAEAVDFTPREVKEVGEGGEYTYLEFSENKKPLTYMPPRNWTYRGGDKRFQLVAPGTNGVEIEFTHTSLKEPLSASEDCLKQFEALAIESLPEGATGVEAPVVNWHPCEVDGYKTVEIAITYVLFGQQVSVSRLYLPRSEDLLIFSVTAKPGELGALRRTFHASLHSLAGL